MLFRSPRLLNWAGSWGQGPPAPQLGCVGDGHPHAEDASFSLPRVPLASLDSKCDYNFGGGSEQEHPSKTEWGVPVASTLVRRSGAEELTLSDPEKHTHRVLRKEAVHPSEKLESPAVPSTGSRRNELWYIHSGHSHPAAQKEDGDC